jgi:hypothetical protein
MIKEFLSVDTGEQASQGHLAGFYSHLGVIPSNQVEATRFCELAIKFSIT